MIYIYKLVLDFIKHDQGISDSSMFYSLPIENMKHFFYTTGGGVVIQNISSCCSLYSFDFVTNCLLSGMPNWGTVLQLRMNICVLGYLF